MAGRHQRIDKRLVVCIKQQIPCAIDIFQMGQRARPDDDGTDQWIGEYPSCRELTWKQALRLTTRFDFLGDQQRLFAKLGFQNALVAAARARALGRRLARWVFAGEHAARQWL